MTGPGPGRPGGPVVVACTGRIGAGKSTASAMLAARGAVVVDLDALARAALAPGGPGEQAVLAAFPAAAGPSGGIDRAGLARVVFADAASRRALESIVHPLVRRGVDAALSSARPPGTVVVLDLPLLLDRDGRRTYAVDGVLVVDCPDEVAIGRLTGARGMTREDVEARLAAQPGREALLAEADYVIANTGSEEDLEAALEGAWAWMRGLAAGRDDDR